ncbi:riboflavin synthase [Roseburia sp. MUC/MUC-530-WT-4D]|uniref:Riboflavin synthase n=1 Tax=Roseburia porci TaxID=2605790 RepID=A0A6L5YP16_9FIRM|nr:riboflavin synthase [Roseburia porci]MST73937.1 riboflavin synthase [Roseburia porci]
MFTGIVEETGTVARIQRTGQSVRIVITAEKILEDIKPGDSIAVNGICLTAAAISGKTFTADVMHETLRRTSLADTKPGCLVNLERAMPADGRFGGHIVSGHIDGTGKILGIKKDSNAIWYTIGTKAEILDCIVEKGSIAVDGISLTVAAVNKNSFQVSVIPHTMANTILAVRKVQDIVNLENDCIGKYVKKYITQTSHSGITKEMLLQNGF